MEDWSTLSAEERRKYIVKNKGQGGRGKKRVLQTLDEVSHIQLEQSNDQYFSATGIQRCLQT